MQYIVRVSPWRKYTVEAENKTAAKEQVWLDIEDGYTYGYKNKDDFMKKAKTERR